MSNTADMRGLLPFKTEDLRELLHIYQTNYAQMREAHNQLLTFMVMMVEDEGGTVYIDISRLQGMQRNGEYQIRIEPQDDGTILKLSVKGPDNEERAQSVSDGPLSTDGPDGGTPADSG